MRSTFKVLFYLKRNKVQSLAPVMGRIMVNGTIAQFSAKIEVPVRLWEVKGGRAKGRVSKPTASTALLRTVPSLHEYRPGRVS